MNQVRGDLPLVGTYDFVVAGGGFAGFGAACAAARQGLRVLLVERLELLGGAGSAAGVGNFSYGRAHPSALGKVFDDVIAALYELKAIGEENGWREHIGYRDKTPVYKTDGSGEIDYVGDRVPLFFNKTFDSSVLGYVLEQIAMNSGVEILYATQVVDAHVEGGTVTDVIVHNRSGLQRVSGTFFIDGTGDGVLSSAAGALILPDDEDHPKVIQPGNMLFMRKGTDEAELMGTLEPELIDDPTDCRSLWPEPNGKVGIKMRMFHNVYDTSTGRGYTDAVIDFRRHIPNFVRYFQQHHTERFGSGWVFDYASPMLGYRESNRIEGDYVLQLDDLTHGRHFDDSVAYAGSCLDSEAVDKAKVPWFQIPYRSLLVKSATNLLVAGRCFSATRVALSSTRVMATGCLMGQAAGYAAALAANAGGDLRSVDTAEVRRLLLDGADDQDEFRKRLLP
jgi:hypothetical protein